MENKLITIKDGFIIDSNGVVIGKQIKTYQKKEKSNREGNCGRPDVPESKLMTALKTSLEKEKIDKLTDISKTKKENERIAREYLRFFANFAYNNGGYEKAINMIQDAIKEYTNKSCSSQCGGCNRDTKN